LTIAFFPKCDIIVNVKEMREMGLDKAIEHKKEHRKEYYGTKAFDRQCRCGGSCDWCRENRLYKNKKRLQKMIDKEKEM
jgi:hypothetical protein